MYVIYVRTVCMCAHTARHGLAHCLLRTYLFLTKQMTAIPPLPTASSTSSNTTTIPTLTPMITAYRRE